ncbi:MAG TPA: GFA family protein [Polyangiales bacterium]|nr:GFA family protein [Polyangiales bacterium]
MTDQTVRGGCFCGRIRYEADAPFFHQTVCHCSICRRTAGAPFVAWFSAARNAFRLIAGTPTRFDSTSHGTRSFCPECGTQLLFEDSELPEELDINSCSLDDPDAIAPHDETHTATRLRWIPLAADLSSYPDKRAR